MAVNGLPVLHVNCPNCIVFAAELWPLLLYRITYGWRGKIINGRYIINLDLCTDFCRHVQRDSKRWTLPLHRQPICSNWWFQRRMLSLVGGWMLKRRRNARCTSVADSVFNELTNAKNLVLHSSHFALNWRCCTAVR